MTWEEIKAWVTAVYVSRKDRSVNPEGRFDEKGRWYPSDREDCGGDGSSTRAPSARWPYSYMLRCRTLRHCRVLVEAALRGEDVPEDVWRHCPVRAQFAPGTPIGIIRDYVLERCPAL